MIHKNSCRDALLNLKASKRKALKSLMNNSRMIEMNLYTSYGVIYVTLERL